MIAKTYSATILGIDAHLIDVEVDVSLGLSVFNIVGLPDSSIRESRDRVITAITNSGFHLPVRKIVVNLAPANLRKIGSGFDLPIAVALLGAMEMFPLEILQDYLIVGELSLDGVIRPIRGGLPIALTAKEQGMKGLILPKANEAEAAVVSELPRIPVETLGEVVGYLKNDLQIGQTDHHIEEFFQNNQSYSEDFQDAKGQEHVKRAMEVAAAGNHNLLLLGPPGSGKTMLARRMASILPLPSFEEALETTKIHSIAGLLPEDVALLATRPFRSPHHTISSAGLVGGGSVPGPGEISLAHNGVLFLDELPEFPRGVLELLRQPLEDHRVVIARASMSLEFPCNFLLLAAMNPCPCGYYGSHASKALHTQKECHCTPMQIQKYRSKISGPLMDRIDIQLFVPAVEYDQLSDQRKGETSASIRKRIIEACGIQQARFQNSTTRNNANMTPKESEQYAQPTADARKILETAMNRLGLSARAYDRILKVARTIADLNQQETIETAHIAEAIQYRSLDRPLKE